MAMDLRFAFVCQKKWNELVGTDPVFRFCPDCSRDIVNLDPLTEEARAKFFRDAQRAGMTPCVFATVQDPNIPSCKDALEEKEEEVTEFPQLGGMPELPDDFDWEPDTDELREEDKCNPERAGSTTPRGDCHVAVVGIDRTTFTAGTPTPLAGARAAVIRKARDRAAWRLRERNSFRVSARVAVDGPRTRLSARCGSVMLWG